MSIKRIFISWQLIVCRAHQPEFSEDVLLRESSVGGFQLSENVLVELMTKVANSSSL